MNYITLTSNNFTKINLSKKNNKQEAAKSINDNNFVALKKTNPELAKVSFGIKKITHAERLGRELGIKSLDIPNIDVQNLVFKTLKKIINRPQNLADLPNKIGYALTNYIPGVVMFPKQKNSHKMDTGIYFSNTLFEHCEMCLQKELRALTETDAMRIGDWSILLNSNYFPRGVMVSPHKQWKKNGEVAPLEERLRANQNIGSLYSDLSFTIRYPKHVLEQTLKTPKMVELQKKDKNVPIWEDYEYVNNDLLDTLIHIRKNYYDSDFPIITPIRDEETPINVMIGYYNYLNQGLLKKNPNAEARINKENQHFLNNEEEQFEAAKLHVYACEDVANFVGYAFDNIMKGIELSPKAQQMMNQYRVGFLM